MFDSPHRRYNPLTDEWILVSPQRLSRPWQGEVGDTEPPSPSYDPECYLCPGNQRVTGEANPDYDGVHIFKNDFAALMEDVPHAIDSGPLLRAETTAGECHVICFSPDHGKSMPQLSLQQIRSLIDVWALKTAELGQKYQSVQIFENKGAMMGCSNPHPHGQIWASRHLPAEIRIEEKRQRKYVGDHGRTMLGDLVQQEISAGERIVVQTEYWLAIVPYWASWPFETLLLPRFAVQRMPDLDVEQRTDLARALRELTTRYDNLFRCSFPYSMGWHGAPYRVDDMPHWRLHAHFYPPLLRSATVRKFMVGYEMLAEAQRDLTPEKAAEMLRAVSLVHYLEDTHS